MIKLTIYETLENGVKIVEYEDSLAAGIADMWNKSRDDWGGDTSIRTANQVISQHAGASFFNVYIAVDDEDVVGYCSLARFFGDADTTYIHTLSVRPDYQGKKVGKALVLRCIERTMELNYPRIDLFTWSGNTKSVPLYKKCGYLWEDRTDYNHFVNFIPSILKTELFADFFKKADWYADSTRTIEIVPDGVKQNNFEFFGYTWENDGEKLEIGYERTGSRMRLIETNDYKIELMAEDHVLAFGLNYNCTFTVENKTGRELNIKIAGKNERNIKFDYKLETQVQGKQEFTSTFFVGEIDEPQNPWRTHPCVLANVEINGKTVVFGIGIEPKYPLLISLSQENKIAQVGMDVESYINIRSGILQDAKVQFTIAENDIIYLGNNYTIDVPAKGKTAIPITAKTLGIGYEAIPVQFDISLHSGEKFSFKKPLHHTNQDLTHAFACEDDYTHSIINGAWRMTMFKSDNTTQIKHLINTVYDTDDFDPPRFGKPYDDEFDLIKPTIKSYLKGTEMVMEAEFVSEKFAGMVITQICTLSASGLASRRFLIENRSKAVQHVIVNDSYWSPLDKNSVFKYKNQITQNHSIPHGTNVHFGIASLDPQCFEENWIFEDLPAYPRGICWPKDYKPNFEEETRLIFEIDPGALEPNQKHETEPIIFAYNMFNNYNDFRNFAMQTFKREVEIPAQRVEICVNGYNPFITEEELKKGITIDVINNRDDALEGELTVVTSNENISQVNTDEKKDKNTFTVFPEMVDSTIHLHTDLKLASYEKQHPRMLFVSKGEITQTQENSIYTVSNGNIIFKVDPKYAHVCYSLVDSQGNEHLVHQHPEHKPFAWWNPFFGGIRVGLPKMNNHTILKESITANFVEVKDCFNNKWNGICSTLTITKDEELKGAIYETYFVTRPGIPMLCVFYRFINNTGVFYEDKVWFGAFLRASEDLKGEKAIFIDENQSSFNLNTGAGYFESSFEDLITISGTQIPMNVFHSSKHSNFYNDRYNKIEGDSKIHANVYAKINCYAAPNKYFISSPMFFYIADNVERERLSSALEKITFKVV